MVDNELELKYNYSYLDYSSNVRVYKFHMVNTKSGDKMGSISFRAGYSE
jgi:hypothetical protein